MLKDNYAYEIQEMEPDIEGMIGNAYLKVEPHTRTEEFKIIPTGECFSEMHEEIVVVGRRSLKNGQGTIAEFPRDVFRKSGSAKLASVFSQSLSNLFGRCCCVLWQYFV